MNLPAIHPCPFTYRHGAHEYLDPWLTVMFCPGVLPPLRPVETVHLPEMEDE